MSSIDDRLFKLRTKVSQRKLKNEGKYVRPHDKIIKLMLDDQVKRCAICESEFTIKNKHHVDHCHKTNKIRGLLCVSCNSGLGMFKDNVFVLERAIRYLKYDLKFRPE